MTDPTRALRNVLADRFGESVEVPDTIAGVDELLRIASQTTHREWSDTPVGPDLVRLLAACALAAPSKSFLQQADIVDVRDPVRRAEVEALVPSMPWLRNAPALLVFCGNGRRFRRLFGRRGRPFVNEHLDGLFNPAVDGALVLMNFIRAATAVGLVCCPISVLRDRAARLGELLAMPDHVFPIAGLCIGYPIRTRAPVPRLALRATVHTDGFDTATEPGSDDALVDEFDRRYVDWRARVAAPGGPPPTAWSDEKLAQYASTQRADWGAFLRARGFDPA